jgi:hypothetical protein
MFKKLFFLITLISNGLYAQMGSISGQVLEKNQAAGAAIGATIKIEGLNLASITDMDGNFKLNKIPAGRYKITASYIGFNTATVDNIIVSDNQNTVVNISLEEANTKLDELVVKSQRLTFTDVSLINEIKEFKQIANGISGQQIQKSQDRDAAAVVRRITGVSIFDDRFIIIRGINERYNTVLLNDLITSSTEVDSKAFSFDQIPSSAIDRMHIFKSTSADLPGDVSGGAVKIYTKTVADENALSIGISTGFRPNLTFQNRIVQSGGSTDWLGFDNGQRALPEAFPSRNSIALGAGSEAVIANFRKLQPFYNVKEISVSPDLRFNVNYSHNWNLKNGRKLSNTSFLNYSNSKVGFLNEQNRYAFDRSVERSFTDNVFSNNVRIGAMSNWALILPKSKFEFRNLISQMSFNETIFRTGFNENVDLNNAALRYEQRTISNTQLAGTHDINRSTILKWATGLGYTYKVEPDYRRFSRSKAKGSSDPFTFDLQQSESPTLQQAARSFSYLDEIMVNTRIDLNKTIKNKKNDENIEIKTGAYADYKSRLFNNKWYGLVNPNRIGLDDKLTQSEPEKFFDPSNLSKEKIYYAVGTNYEDQYVAENQYMAAYASASYPISKQVSLYGGLRSEYNVQQLNSRERGSGNKFEINNPQFNLLPSSNLTYKINSKHLLRAAYAQTVNRPEFRELAPFTYYDFAYDVTRTGFIPTAENKELKNAIIQNFDLRYEYYPSDGEVISVAVFNKTFKNPIEAKLFYNGSNVAFTVTNADFAYTRGIEVELRSKLSQNLTALLNGSLIKSNVRTAAGQGLSERSLQGQSPYLINAGLFYELPEKGLQINAQYNVIGKRIFVIGDEQISANIYEVPRNVIDLNLSKKITSKIDVKVAVQDLLNQPSKLVQDTNRNNKLESTDGIFQNLRRGQNITVGVNIRL